MYIRSDILGKETSETRKWTELVPKRSRLLVAGKPKIPDLHLERLLLE